MSRHLERGRRLLELRRSREAASEFAREAGGDVADDRCEASAMLALIAVESGSTAQAAEHLADARRVDPLHPLVRWAAAVLAVRAGDIPLMRRELLALRATAPGDADIIGLAATLEHEAGDFEAALFLANEGLGLNPADEDCLQVAAAACANLGRLGEERSYAERLVRLNPLISDAHVHLARHALSRDDLAGASAHSFEALRVSPNDANAHAVLFRAAAARHWFGRLTSGRIGGWQAPFWLRLAGCFAPTFLIEIVFHVFDAGRVPPVLWRATSPGVLLGLWLSCFLGWQLWLCAARAIFDRSSRLALKAQAQELLAMGLPASVMAVLLAVHVVAGTSVTGVVFCAACVAGALVLALAFRPAFMRPWFWAVCGAVFAVAAVGQVLANQGVEWAPAALFGLALTLVATLALAAYGIGDKLYATPPALPTSPSSHEPPSLPR